MSKKLNASTVELIDNFFKMMKLTRSYYPFTVCIEGPDGVGKTTLINQLESAIDNYGPQSGAKLQKNSVVLKYPSATLYDTLVNGTFLTSFERTLLYIADGIMPPDDMDFSYLHYSVIILDRSPLFSVPVYNFPKLNQQYLKLAAYALSNSAMSMMVPNLTIILENNSFEQDYTHAANVLSQEDIASGYNYLTGDGTLYDRLIKKWPALKEINGMIELDGVSLGKSLKLDYDNHDYNVGSVIQMMTEVKENI